MLNSIAFKIIPVGACELFTLGDLKEEVQEAALQAAISWCDPSTHPGSCTLSFCRFLKGPRVHSAHLCCLIARIHVFYFFFCSVISLLRVRGTCSSVWEESRR